MSARVLLGRIGLRGADLAAGKIGGSATDGRRGEPGAAIGFRAATGCRQDIDRGVAAGGGAAVVIAAAFAIGATVVGAELIAIAFEAAGALWAARIRVGFVDAALNGGANAIAADLIRGAFAVVATAEDDRIADTFEAGGAFRTARIGIGIVDAAFELATVARTTDRPLGAFMIGAAFGADRSVLRFTADQTVAAVELRTVIARSHPAGAALGTTAFVILDALVIAALLALAAFAIADAIGAIRAGWAVDRKSVV